VKKGATRGISRETPSGRQRREATDQAQQTPATDREADQVLRDYRSEGGAEEKAAGQLEPVQETEFSREAEWPTRETAG